MSQLYNNTKLFHFKSKLDDLEEGKVSAPIHIRMKPTNRCNHRCNYCCYRNDSLFLSELLREKDMIPREKMREIVSDLSEMGVKAVTFTGGGEPLNYPYINETMTGLLEGGVKISTLTNGALLSGETAEILAGGATWVRISMDATESDLYAETRGVSLDEFDKVCRNIREFAKIKKASCELGISYIVNHKNHRNLVDYFKLMKDSGVNHVKVSACVVSTEGKKNNEYYESFRLALQKQLSRAIEEVADDRFKIIDRFHGAAETYSKSYTSCFFVHYLTIIAADQHVYTCQDKAYTTSGKLGCLKEQSFKDFWFGPENQKRIFGINPSVDCNHHCVQHSKNLMLLDYLEADKDHLDFV